MPTTCCVVKCRRRGNRDRVKFFRIPSVLQFPHKPELNELSKIRRLRWIHAIKRKDITEFTLKYSRVCSKHFITGKPAELIDQNNTDWVPSLLMGYGEDSKRVIKRVAINAARQEREEKRMKLDEHVLEVAAEITEETNTTSRDLQHVNPIDEAGGSNINDKGTQTDVTLENQIMLSLESIKGLQRKLEKIEMAYHYLKDNDISKSKLSSYVVH